MKWTKLLVSILCLICLLTTGYIAEGSGSGQLAIEVPNLATNLPIDWRPEAGNSLSFSVQVTRPPNYSGGRLTAKLSEVTNYMGSCGNGWSIDNDLELRQYLYHNRGWRMESYLTLLSHPIAENFRSSAAVEWISLEVSCEDYAAYGKLTFATTESSIEEADPVEIIIPRDINENKIADSWRDDETTADPNNSNPSKNYAPTWDQESGPDAPNAERGDNLTVLDEYRGLYVNGTWTDTDPEGWDVFIRSESGLGAASSLPGMTPHLMGLYEVNHVGGSVMRYPTSIFIAYAIRLQNNPVAYDRDNPSGPLGHMGLGPPSSGTKGDIYTDRIRETLQPDQTESGIIAYVAAHEIGHGVHLHHCPDHTGLNCYMWGKKDAMAHHVTQFHSHHLEDCDLKIPSSAPRTPFPIPENHKRSYHPGYGTWMLLGPGEIHGITIVGNSEGTIISTNTGYSSSYGCDYNAEYDYCTDTGTCTTRTNATGIWYVWTSVVLLRTRNNVNDNAFNDNNDCYQHEHWL